MSYNEISDKFSERHTNNRRSSTDTTHWNPRDESLFPAGVEKSANDPQSPTSSITEHSAPVVNVLKIAQDWQKQQLLQAQQQQEALEEKESVREEEKEQKSEKRVPFPEQSRDHPPNLNQQQPLILEPKELHQQNFLSERERGELFVELCFYARLGFVQPPCCLLCTYCESTEGQTPQTDCSRWVIWRRNAEIPLHPHQLEGNILVTQCRVARTLLNGSVVDGYEWDKSNKQLVLCCSDSEKS